ncbi:methyl-accepting chemotaxis protein [Parasalinivibrio latis]|uniref:methyl-accepting chemotaxis protein n=1 Tax=Parasalinivibrio latis TaxID=2952610 RepID=UPI0030E1DC20
MTLKIKLFVTLTMLTMIIIAVGLTGTFSLDSQSTRYRNISELRTVTDELNSARIAVVDYMLTGKQEFKDTVTKELEEAIAVLDAVQERYTFDAAYIEELSIIEGYLAVFSSSFNEFSSIYEQQKKTEVSRNSSGQVMISLSSILVDDAARFSEKKDAGISDKWFHTAAISLNKSFFNMHISAMRYSGDPTGDNARFLAKNVKDATKKLKRTLGLATQSSAKERLKSIDSEFKNYTQLVEHSRTYNEQLNTVRLQLQGAVMNASNTVSALNQSEQSKNSTYSSTVKTLIYVVIIVAFGLSTLVSIWLIRSIMVPLRQSMSFASQIASGNLAERLEVSRKDEFGVLNTALNQSAESLSSMIAELRDVCSSILQSCEVMEQSVGQSTQAVDTQLGETSAIANALTEMTSSAVNIADNTRDGSEQSDLAKNSAAEGTKMLERSMNAIRALSDSMAVASKSVTKLQHDSENIGNILSVIRGIAEQTNLLALNAAIEAARAGTMGRGFAVVADEVRALASKTQDSVEEITEIVETIQNGANSVSSAIEEANGRSTDVRELSAHSSDAYKDIASAIERIARFNEEVSLAAASQSATAEEVTDNIMRVKDLSEGNAQQLHEISEQAATQSEQAKTLFKLVGVFKV